jgi:hypothetical protein
MIAHVFREVDLLRLAVRLDLDHAAAGAVIRRDKHAIPRTIGVATFATLFDGAHTPTTVSAVLQIETQPRAVGVKKTTCVPPFTFNGIAEE